VAGTLSFSKRIFNLKAGPSSNEIASGIDRGSSLTGPGALGRQHNLAADAGLEQCPRFLGPGFSLSGVDSVSTRAARTNRSRDHERQNANPQSTEVE
jgi:hypothetical protein